MQLSGLTRSMFTEVSTYIYTYVNIPVVHFLCFEFGNCIIGIDLEPGREGGTWLAIGGHGGVFKIGALLNLTGEPKPRNAVGKG